MNKNKNILTRRMMRSESGTNSLFKQECQKTENNFERTVQKLPILIQQAKVYYIYIYFFFIFILLYCYVITNHTKIITFTALLITEVAFLATTAVWYQKLQASFKGLPCLACVEGLNLPTVLTSEAPVKASLQDGLASLMRSTMVQKPLTRPILILQLFSFYLVGLPQVYILNAFNLHKETWTQVRYC